MIEMIKEKKAARCFQQQKKSPLPCPWPTVSKVFTSGADQQECYLLEENI